MSDNQKYYYIKLKDNYFEQDNIKVLESMKNGYIYSLILIKMYLRASKHNGRLMMTQTIPYEPNNIEVLASVLGHDVDHVKETIRIGVDLDLIAIIDGREIWLTEIQNFIGQSSTEADRIRRYRTELKEKEMLKITEKEEPVQMYDKCTPEIELKKEPKIKKEIDYQSFLDLYNRVCPSLPKAIKITDKRRGIIRSAVEEHGIETIVETLSKVEEYPFLIGENDKGWKADFEWLMNKNNLLKVMEGRYKRKPQKHKGSREGYDLNLDGYKRL